MDIHEIRFPTGTNGGVCEVVEGASKRVFRTTPRAIAIALLGAQTPEEAAGAAAGEITWTDYLSTHGLAVGHKGKRTYTLAVLPSQERTVNYTGPRGEATTARTAGALTCQFPPMLIGLVKDGAGTQAFKRGVVCCLASANLAHLSVRSNDSVATTFPYGNVYSGTGYICWGSVPHTHIQTVKDIEELFFGSDFNGDLWQVPSYRFDTLVTKYKGKSLPLATAANLSVPAIIRNLTA